MRGRLRKSVIAATRLIIVAGTIVAVPNSAVTERLIEHANPATGVDFGRDSEREGVLNAADYARLSLLVRQRTNVATMLQSARL